MANISNQEMNIFAKNISYAQPEAPGARRVYTTAAKYKNLDYKTFMRRVVEWGMKVET